MSTVRTHRVDGPAEAEPVLRVRGLRRSFGSRLVLGGVDLTLGPREFVALLGPSGCGKSTLLRAVAGLDPEAAGTIERRARHAIVFQEPRLLPWKSVWRNVAIGLPWPLARERAHQALVEVGLLSHAEAWPLTLSGGEAQRVALARALVREPGLLLLDEPFGALDALTRLRAQALVARLCEVHGPAVVLVTHDVDEALLLADRVLVLTEGRIVFDARVSEARHGRRAGAGHDGLRRRLLHELGVDDPPSSARPTPPGADTDWTSSAGPRDGVGTTGELALELG
jgi:sulfonate transport system ATP-binding protein